MPGTLLRRIPITLGVMLLASCALAQNMLPSIPAVSPDVNTDGALPSAEHLVVSVDVVEVYFNVRSSGTLVPGLPRDEFEVLENGRRVPVRYFSKTAEQPLRVGLMIDSSGSQTRVLQVEKDVARKFLDRTLTGADEAMVVAFDSGVELMQDFTGSHSSLQEALDRVMRVSSQSSSELGDKPVGQRSTALYDAIKLSSEHKMDTMAGRKVFIILTDGEDMGSRIKADEAIAAAARSDVICYVLLIADSNVSSRKGYRGEAKMRELAVRTGGRLVKVNRKLTDLEKRFDEISLELRNQYSVGYTPVDRTGRGEYRTLSVKSRHGFKVQARQGYYARFGQK